MSTTGRSISVCASTNTMASPEAGNRNRAWVSPTTSSQRNTVLRISYARTMESPFNENLVLASLGCTNPVIAAFQNLVPGGACVTTSPLSPGLRNEFHAGLSQAFGKYLVLDGEYIWKYTHNAFDFSVLANTPITYPIEWTKSKIPGYAIRLTMPNFHGLTAFMVTSSVAARFFSPQVAGVGATPVGFGVFRIDHDETNNATGHLQYQAPLKWAPWFSFNWRYDSGLVAGPVPCAGGEACPNGPGGSDTVVDVSQSHARPTVRRGALLRARACDTDHADQSHRPLPSEPVRFLAGIHSRSGH